MKIGKTYRFRFLNASPLSHLNVVIESHFTLIAISLDGHRIEPIEVSSVDLHSGQRVDILVKMNQPSTQNYWMNVITRSRVGNRYLFFFFFICVRVCVVSRFV